MEVIIFTVAGLLFYLNCICHRMNRKGHVRVKLAPEGAKTHLKPNQIYKIICSVIALTIFILSVGTIWFRLEYMFQLICLNAKS